MTTLQRLGLWSALASSCFAMACAADDQAVISTPAAPIAVGSYLPLDMTDACRGGGKLNFCGSDAIVAVDTIDVANPKVVAVLRMSEIDQALRIPYYNLVVDAKAAGQTAVAIDATFDDGSRRHAEATLSTQKADRMELVHSCPVLDAGALDLFAPGVDVDLSVELFHGAAPLLGEHRKDLVAGEGIARVQGYLVSNSYRWTVPSVAKTVKLTSPVFSAFSTKYRIYDVNELHIDAIEPTYDLSQPVGYQTFVHLDFAASVGGKIPCRLPEVQLETLSPEICDGAQGATLWSDDPSYGLSVRALKTGTCQLVASITGATETHPLAIDISVEQPEPGTVDPCQGVTCDGQITTCPTGSELVTQNCCNACSPVPDAVLCESERSAWDALYEAHRAGTLACTTNTDCSTTVLVGGCRRYCYLPFAAQQVSPFMNAVAEAYHTSCPHCAVPNPASCTDVITGFACVEGQCTLVR